MNYETAFAEFKAQRIEKCANRFKYFLVLRNLNYYVPDSTLSNLLDGLDGLAGQW